MRSHSANSRPDLHGARKYNRLGSPNRGNSLLSLDDRSRGERGDSKDPEERIRKKDNFILAPQHRSLHTGCQCTSRTVLVKLRLRHSWLRSITVITRQQRKYVGLELHGESKYISFMGGVKDDYPKSS